jgi:hypothetical protein
LGYRKAAFGRLFAYTFLGSCFNPYSGGRLVYRDSSFASLGEATKGATTPFWLQRQLVLIDVPRYGLDGFDHIGQLVAHETVAPKFHALFVGLYWMRFPLGTIIPISQFRYDDNASMAANNCSCQNWRVIAGTDIVSHHGYGAATDLNPILNPYKELSGRVDPPGAVYNPEQPGTLVDGSPAVELILRLGGSWGGHWKTKKDYQHVEFPIPGLTR